jgi:hypothetical protein
MDKYYAGIGARKTPVPVLNQMSRLAMQLDNCDYILRSGGAIGADSAFEIATDNAKIFKAENYTSEAMKIAKQYHPAWNKLSEFVKQLMARNVLIVLGEYLDTPADFVICWTPGGNVVGGTGHALRVAKEFSIPILNLWDKEIVDINIFMYHFLK